MKIGTWILTISLAASAWAQSPAPKPQATAKPQAASTPQATPKPQTVKQQSAAKPNASSPAKPAAAAAKSAAPAAKSAQTAAAEKQVSASSTAATKPGKAKPAHQTAKQAAGKPAAGKQEPAKPEKGAKESPGKTVAKATSVHQGKRDPFVSPIQERKLAVCTVGGKRCLFVGDINLIGIVESSNGVVAVVAYGRHTYFLRENDPLADGEVERITSDTITLRQRTSDLMGKPVVREVTRRIGMPAA